MTCEQLYNSLLPSTAALVGGYPTFIEGMNAAYCCHPLDVYKLNVDECVAWFRANRPLIAELCFSDFSTLVYEVCEVCEEAIADCLNGSDDCEEVLREVAYGAASLVLCHLSAFYTGH